MADSLDFLTEEQQSAPARKAKGAMTGDLQRESTEQKIAALQAEIVALQATLPPDPAVETFPDVWDSQGRLISNDRNNPV